MNEVRTVEIAPEAAAKAKLYGDFGQTPTEVVERLQRMCKRSAPLTHQLGNRRFDRYALRIENGVLLDLFDLTQA